MSRASAATLLENKAMELSGGEERLKIIGVETVNTMRLGAQSE
jgi:hypothetical protein